MMSAGMKIGFVGVGRMGSPMSRFLLKAGYPVMACDPDPEALARAKANGATTAASVAECARAADVVFSSIPDDKVLHKVALGDAGVLANVRPGTIYVDTSTVSPSASGEVGKAAAARGIPYLRMPMSGNSFSAEKGELTALVSGPPEAWEKVKPAVEKFTVARVYVGAEEQARYMKLVINLLVISTGALMAEALALGRKGGLEWGTMLDGLAASTIGSPWVKAKAQLLKAHDYTPTGTPHLVSKDLDLMLRAGDELGVPLPITSLTRQLMKATIAEGYGDEDFIAVVKLFERLAGLPVERA
jgi:3-hydroxyisobutyrate dehydrogenase